MNNERKDSLIFIVLAILLIGTSVFMTYNNDKILKVESLKVNLANLTVQKDNEEKEIKTYTQEEFETFYSDYRDGNLDDIYITKFLFDGVSMYKTYDLDDFIEGGNDVETSSLEITVINVNTSNVELTGEIKGAMIAVNTNDIKDDININLNGVNVDTDSKKVPVMYVYNKNMNYTEHKVTIKALSNTKNYLEGGKLKKVSLIPSSDLESYENYYTGANKENYALYTNYYGIYDSSEIDNILFAKVKTDNEGLQDGDPYYFYKASGAISSDIDLYFEGNGYLKVTSKNKEGIETKGNLTFTGGTGDYEIIAEDDCLNTTTDKTQGNDIRNILTIDVNSLVAFVSLDSDEGDAIDSNGELIINGGTIIALSKPGQDAGLDSKSGTYINGGTVIATGDMYDQIGDKSKQKFIVLSFANSIATDELITMLDENDTPVFAYKTDRNYKYLVYSSSKLEDAIYTLYIDGEIDGDFNYGFYTSPSEYTKGNILAYTTSGMMGIGQNEQTEKPNMEGEREEMMPPEMPNDGNIQNGEFPPEKPDDGNGEMPPKIGNENIQQFPNNGEQNFTGNEEKINNFQNVNAVNKEFTITGTSNLFNGIAKYETQK